MPNELIDGPLPTIGEIAELLKNIEEIIGLSASCPQDSRYHLMPPPDIAQRYELLWNQIDSSLRQIRSAGFPLFHANPHRTLRTMWAWPWTLEGGGAKKRMERPRELYSESIKELQALKDSLSTGVDAPGELLRELRASITRRTEVFAIMAFRPETNEFWLKVVEPAAVALSLKPVRIDKEETEEAISEAILSSIRRALLVVCDLSFERPNCYFEAGYAKGCFRRVIFTARQDHNPRMQPSGPCKVHFDVDQFKITWWSPDAYATAREELKQRIEKILVEIQK